jgi:gamma-glutamyl-gamma-aminobutyrate hydrolase PuuD/uncharacterized protein YjbI with pentapeptide repeats
MTFGRFDISSTSLFQNLGKLLHKRETSGPVSANAALSGNAPPAEPAPVRHAHSAARVRALGRPPGTPDLPNISASELKDIIDEARQSRAIEIIDLAVLLEQKGFQKALAGIHLSDKNSPSLKGMKLDGIDFQECSFDWSHLSESSIGNCQFSGCTFGNVSFQNSTLRDCAFEDCTFHEAMFLHADLSNVQFLGSTLTRISFEDARIADSGFDYVAMPGTHFLNAAVSQSRIDHSDLTDTVFFGKKDAFTIDAESGATAKLTKPTTASLVSAETRGISVPLVGVKIADVAQTNLLRVAMQTPMASKEDVDREVEEILHAVIGTSAGPQEEPLPQRLLQAIAEHPDKYPHAAAIVAKAKGLAEHVDSVVLPGGEDVSPHLYGEDNRGARWNGDYRRSLMELELIHQCFHKAIPLMAICRGFQMTCVYFGAKLHQDIGDDQVGVRIVGERAQDAGELASGAEIYGNQLEDIRVAVYHHQAVPNAELPHMTIPLARTIEHDGKAFKVVMALARKFGAPMMAFQFHPEFFKQNPKAVAGDPDLTNDELIRLANAYQRPGSQEHGLRDPTDMVNSGILDHMSAENDGMWKIVAEAADAHRAKKGITGEVLQQARLGLHEPANRVPPKRNLWTSAEARIADIARPQRRTMRSLRLMQLKAIAENDNLSLSVRNEAEKEIRKRIDPFAESGGSIGGQK